MKLLYVVTAGLLILSALADRGKTYQALKVAWKRFAKIFPSFLTMLIFVSILTYLVPNELIVRYLGGAGNWVGLALASLFGSITLMPGFIAFPLSGLLLKQGVSYMTISAFTTTLMMVGVLTFPVEQKYFGTRAAFLRNLASLLVAVVVALCIGIVYGEVF
ncbi:MAG: hypothetical protein H0Z38_01135 [Firmicutes bacterium]|nr:hypothetical protein [Bacillota bacterium]